MNANNKNRFLYPQHTYHGEKSPNRITFNATLQEFTQRISYITALETNGKLDAEQAYQQINTLWQQLRHSYKKLDSQTSVPLSLNRLANNSTNP